MAEFHIAGLTPDTWPAFAALAERHNGVFGGCWCTYFHRPCNGTGEGNRAAKERLVREGVAHAALVFDGEEAIAWCEYGTPTELPNIHHRKQYDTEADLVPDYRITCIFVDRRYRRRGVAEIALRGALDLVAREGGGIVEGYPHDLAGQQRKMSSSFLYNGTRTLYERCGFDFVRAKGAKNTVMRRSVLPV